MKIKTSTWIIGLIGLYYILAPHSFHMQYSPDWLLGFGFQHTTHNLIGLGLVILAYFNQNKSEENTK